MLKLPGTGKHAQDTQAERTYAGVLGKIIGVYLGRPVEGWSYEAIAEHFGEVNAYVHEAVGAPLIVADDDISGTFAFFRAIEEHGYPPLLSPAHVGQTWLNQIVADRTILWWGGLGRSTEHTAWLRLKAGVPAPESGSIARNGRTVAEQIGAQIFIDAFAMACPGDPERAAALARSAASVSHDGLAVECAAFLAALEALAFEIRDVNLLLDSALPLVQEPRLLRLVEDVRTICATERDWRGARARVNEQHGYRRYGGHCPIGTNHAAVLMALLLGGDDFGRALMIAVSAGWDTDCNAGNVGCINGIRLGLDAIPERLRAPVADRLLVVASEGGRCVSDAVIETRAILHTGAQLRGMQPPPASPRFAFEFRGARQGWERCPSLTTAENASLEVTGPDQWGDGNGLVLPFANLREGRRAAFSTPTFVALNELTGGYSTVCSPSLYPTQTVTAHLLAEATNLPDLSFYVLFHDQNNQVQRAVSERFVLHRGVNVLSWTLPPMDGMPVQRIGIELLSPQGMGARVADGHVRLLDLDWDAAPANLMQPESLSRMAGTPQPAWLRAWVSSARHFAGDHAYTYVVSHPEDGGVVTMGTREWRDYEVSSRVTFSLHKSGGLVLRSQGHRRYHAARLCGGGSAEIVRIHDGECTVLARGQFPYEEERAYLLNFAAVGTLLSFSVDGVQLLEARDADTKMRAGGAGFFVEEGTLLASGFSVRKL